MDEGNEKNPLFDTSNVSYGAAPLQQLLLLQSKDLMRSRWLVLLDQQEQSGGKPKALRAFTAAVTVLYEELRPRIKSKQETNNYPYNLEVMDSYITGEKPEPVKLMRLLFEYLELDLKLTKVDMKQEYESQSVWRKQGFKG